MSKNKNNMEEKKLFAFRFLELVKNNLDINKPLNSSLADDIIFQIGNLWSRDWTEEMKRDGNNIIKLIRNNEINPNKLAIKKVIT